MTFGAGPDELDVAGLADFGEVRALGQEPVAGMDRVGAGDLGGAQHRRHVEIAVGAPRRTDADVLVGEPDVQRVLVGLGVHRDGLDAELAAGADDAQRDLPAVGDQDFLEHRSIRSPSVSGLDGEQPLAVLHRLAVLDVGAHDLAVVLRGDLVHQLHRFDDAEHLILLDALADFDERRGARLRRSIERPDDRRLHHRQLQRRLVDCRPGPRASDRRGCREAAAGRLAPAVSERRRNHRCGTRPVACGPRSSTRLAPARTPGVRAAAPARGSARYRRIPITLRWRPSALRAHVRPPDLSTILGTRQHLAPASVTSTSSSIRTPPMPGHTRPARS